MFLNYFSINLPLILVVILLIDGTFSYDGEASSLHEITCQK